MVSVFKNLDVNSPLHCTSSLYQIKIIDIAHMTMGVNLNHMVPEETGQIKQLPFCWHPRDFPGQVLGCQLLFVCVAHDDVIKWKHFPRYWPFVRGIPRSPVYEFPAGQWLRALMFSLICPWIYAWVNNREAGDLRRHPRPSLWRHCNASQYKDAVLPVYGFPLQR